VNREVEVAEIGWMGSGMCECKNGDLSKVDRITPFTLHPSPISRTRYNLVTRAMGRKEIKIDDR
jgi:hypothetical protein